jgi:hypothetical protein
VVVDVERKYAISLGAQERRSLFDAGHSALRSRLSPGSDSKIVRFEIGV